MLAGMDKVAASRSYTGVIFGLFLAVMGLALTAGNLGLLPYPPTLIDFLPVALLLVALDRLFAGRPAKACWMAIAAGVVAWVRFAPDFRFRDLRELAPLLPILFGVWLVFRAIRGRRSPEAKLGSGGELALLSSVRSVLQDQAYRGGTAMAILGGHVLDLRQARLADEGASLQVFAFWGGIEVIVPESMAVSLEVNTLLGGAEDKTGGRKQIPGTPGLVLRGLVLMGGIEIHS